jgi:hypothetical protein
MHILVALSLLTTLTASSSASEPMWMRVTTSTLMAPAHMKVQVFVEPHSDNRLLTIEVDGTPLYRASDVQLEGARARRAHLLEVDGLMAGEYVVRASVHGAGSVRAVTEQRITLFGQ